ncbi:putative GMP synthase [glutamine-hydrolyzing] [Planktothrix tepida]|uniref:GCN5-related N-acetyltransferase n=1 Tax=Planktothrix tepida PCC 9214 TaxID=671072 RepID=A0A1J1LS20_9CYAN|nr:GNAT family N-acetyltransferase [Planktothrix tepida]CAD5990415.1 putative GMP synthase [glutamine-hydrolyzing] [Planktothrix tepida]CUR35381.1 GCN5-related N-acetyltransferase [Planktothrix tepida PCC 9214]
METNPINQEFTGAIATLPLHQYQPNTWETERLFLRPFIDEDLIDLHRVYRNPEVMRFVVNKTKINLAETEAELKSYLDHWQQYNFGHFAIIHKELDVLIGRSGLYFNERSPYPQFGYILDKPYWGQGLGTELALANLDYGFNILNFETIAAFAMVENSASRKILSEKLKMRLLTKQFHYLQGTLAYYVIERSQYLTQQMLH